MTKEIKIMSKSEIYRTKMQNGKCDIYGSVNLKGIPAYNSEEVENMRRMAERGLEKSRLEGRGAYVDMFQYILDCYGRVYNK